MSPSSVDVSGGASLGAWRPCGAPMLAQRREERTVITSTLRWER